MPRVRGFPDTCYVRADATRLSRRALRRGPGTCCPRRPGLCGAARRRGLPQGLEARPEAVTGRYRQLISVVRGRRPRPSRADGSTWLGQALRAGLRRAVWTGRRATPVGGLRDGLCRWVTGVGGLEGGVGARRAAPVGVAGACVALESAQRFHAVAAPAAGGSRARLISVPPRRSAPSSRAADGPRVVGRPGPSRETRPAETVTRSNGGGARRARPEAKSRMPL